MAVRPVKTHISLGIHPIWSVFAVHMNLTTHGSGSSLGAHSFCWFCYDADYNIYKLVQFTHEPSVSDFYSQCSALTCTHKTSHLSVTQASSSTGCYSIWAATWQNQQNDLCAQRRLHSAWASAQSGQSLHYPHEGPKLPIERLVKTLISLCGCPGWSESSLGTHVIWLVLLCGSLYYDETALLNSNSL